jgi:hypothetical protein
MRTTLDLDVVDKPVTKEQILAEYDELRKTVKHTIARQTLMDTWSPCEGWSINKVYNLIQNERPTVTSGPFARTKKVKPTPEVEASKTEAKAPEVKAVSAGQEYHAPQDPEDKSVTPGFLSVLNVQDEINGLHSEIVGLAQRALDNAIRIGELLTAKKAELAHGEFLPWLKNNVNFGPDAAERYRIV